MENVIKECEEEASIPADLSQKAVPCGAVSYSSVTSAGAKREVLFLYDLELPPDFVPVPSDGEVCVHLPTERTSLSIAWKLALSDLLHALEHSYVHCCSLQIQ